MSCLAHITTKKKGQTKGKSFVDVIIQLLFWQCLSQKIKSKFWLVTMIVNRQDKDCFVTIWKYLVFYFSLRSWFLYNVFHEKVCHMIFLYVMTYCSMIIQLYTWLFDVILVKLLCTPKLFLYCPLYTSHGDKIAQTFSNYFSPLFTLFC